MLSCYSAHFQLSNHSYQTTNYERRKHLLQKVEQKSFLNSPLRAAHGSTWGCGSRWDPLQREEKEVGGGRCLVHRWATPVFVQYWISLPSFRSWVHRLCILGNWKHSQRARDHFIVRPYQREMTWYYRRKKTQVITGLSRDWQAYCLVWCMDRQAMCKKSSLCQSSHTTFSGVFYTLSSRSQVKLPHRLPQVKAINSQVCPGFHQGRFKLQKILKIIC